MLIEENASEQVPTQTGWLQLHADMHVPLHLLTSPILPHLSKLILSKCHSCHQGWQVTISLTITFYQMSSISCKIEKLNLICIEEKTIVCRIKQTNLTTSKGAFTNIKRLQTSTISFFSKNICPSMVQSNGKVEFYIFI